jgi:hypothetical protein
MTLAGPPVPAHASLPAARAYLASHYIALHVQFNAARPRTNGYALYFTVILLGGRSAFVMKLCEDRNGRVTGSSNVSYGEASC